MKIQTKRKQAAKLTQRPYSVISFGERETARKRGACVYNIMKRNNRNPRKTYGMFKMYTGCIFRKKKKHILKNITKYTQK